MLNKIFLRFHTGFTLSLIYVTLISHGRLPPKINIHLIAHKKKTSSPKMSTVKNPTFTFDLTQIQVVPFQCN